MSTQPRFIDVSTLPPFRVSNQAPLWWGQLSMCFIEGSMFAVLAAMYLYLRMSVDVWPPPGTDRMGVLLPTLGLVPLLLSTWGSYLSSEAAKRDDRNGMVLGLVMNLLFAGAFLALRWAEWRSFTFTWRSDAHGTIVWSILFLHTFDVVADLIFTADLAVILLFSEHGTRQRMAVHVDSVVWYFLVGIWIPLYVLIYWGPRIAGGP